MGARRVHAESFRPGADAGQDNTDGPDGTDIPGDPDGVRLVRDNSADADADTEQKSLTYNHDANGKLTTIGDTSSTASIDTYDIAYTGLNQVQKVSARTGRQMTCDHRVEPGDPIGRTVQVQVQVQVRG
ncbi:hypothetical protein [Streptomyces beihaiensis]|uniref:YD repeat-containing protein n=1 Tax=Streptomyces beihaiensis TaxID=2984495 RepID=A0ABT3TRJ1_9ACTN|nr:hypothetical protein [Streptomyces beihaiensis]MCX3058648.1 hypothetical protein [Streptomyces beihaiensis]